MRPFKCKAGAGAGFLIVALAGCNVIDPIDSDPNAVPIASVDQLFVGVQVNWMLQEEGQVSRLAAIWMNQMDGTDRQFSGLAEYVFGETNTSGQFGDMYTGGGLIDLRLAQAAAADAGRTLYLGILKFYEAYMIGMGASIFGDIPYTEAVNPEIAEPVLDPQATVYAAVLTLLDGAISDLGGGGAGPASADFSFGGDAAAWIAVANTAKARLNMHWAEVDGASRYTAALAAAANGIATPAGDWKTTHSTAATEQNLWSQFMRDRSGYISAGATLVNLMNATSDPRLPVYFALDADGVYSGSPAGSPAGDPGSTASGLSATGYGATDFDFPVMTAAENQFIIAEAEFAVGTSSAALAALDAAVAFDAQAKGVTLPVPSATITATALTLADIMTAKYISQFLNRDAWNDYKRTCVQPTITFNGEEMPGRLFYDQEERESNSNILDASQQPLRNANDPNGC